MIKLNLTSCLFHVKLNSITQRLFVIKCHNKYFKIKALPKRSECIALPNVQSHAKCIFRLFLIKDLDVKILNYLDVILLGDPATLEKATTILFASSYLFNLKANVN